MALNKMVGLVFSVALMAQGAAFAAGGKVGGYTCEEQKKWGKCAEAWMSPVCDYVCKDAKGNPIKDENAGKVGGYTCEEQKKWGKCGESWMSPVCDSVCKGADKGADKAAADKKKKK